MTDKRLRYLSKQPKRGRAQGPKNIRVKITSNGKLSLEELTEALQKAFAKLEGHGVFRVENCSIYLAPRGEDGHPVTLKDEKGRELDVVEIYVPVAARFSKATAA